MSQHNGRFMWNYGSLDVRALHRTGLLLPGSHGRVAWNGVLREEIEFDAEESTIHAYRTDAADGRSVLICSIDVEWTSCNFGGLRPWFLCPQIECGRRAAILYTAGTDLACRECRKLLYRSQYAPAWFGAQNRAEQARRKLRAVPELGAALPARPKFMRHKTYERLIAEIEFQSEREMRLRDAAL